MVAFTRLAVAGWVIAGILAGATAESLQPAAQNIDIEERTAPDFELGADHLSRRQDYTQNYKTSGTVDFTPANNGYLVSFSGAGDFVVGKGWKTGTTSGSTTASAGTVLVSVYGWSRGPLVEYYIQEYSNGAGAAQGTKVGSLYQQVNQPSIAGTTTFWQYISVRTSMRPGGGVVTVANHFNAWAKAGMNLGTLGYQTVSTEGWENAGGISKYTIS